MDGFVVPKEAVDISPSADGGILKLVHEEGKDDSDYPLNGNFVKVIYSGQVSNGEHLAGALDRDNPLHFIIGVGNVVDAWDIGIKTMQKGEKAQFFCKPKYCYKEQEGKTESIMFDIELIDFGPVLIGESVNYKIWRMELLTAGSGHSPRQFDHVTVELSLNHSDSVLYSFELLSRPADSQLPIGLDAIETLLLNMLPKERSLVSIEDSASSELVVEARLTAIKRRLELWKCSTAERLEEASRCRGVGNDLFGVEMFDRALRWYERSLVFLETDAGMDEQQRSDRDSLRLASHCNAAMCHLKMERWQEAVASCNSALEIDRDCVKALYRRGGGRIQLKDFHGALGDFSRVLWFEKGNGAAKRQADFCEKKLAVTREKQRRLFAGVFGKMAELGEIEEYSDIIKPDLFSSVDYWENSLAEGMLPLDEEQKAFADYD